MNNLENAIVELETRLAFQEDTINQLNDVVSRQDGDLMLLKEQVRTLAQRLLELQRLPSQGGGDLVDERPPHY